MKKLLVFVSLLSLPVIGYTKASGHPNDSRWTVGLGLVTIGRAYRGVDQRTVPFPMLAYQGPRFFVRGPEAGWNVLKQKRYSLAGVVRYRFAGFDPDDSTFLTGMEKRKDTVEAGVTGKVRLGRGVSVSGSMYVDTLDRHKGTTSSLTLAKMFRFDRLILGPKASLFTRNGSLANYYYGVRGSEATSARPAYRAGSHVSTGVGFNLTYRFPKVVLFTNSTVEFLDSEIRNSPIVEDSAEWRSIIGLSYQF